MPEPTAIGEINDTDQIRVQLLASGRAVHAPLQGLVDRAIPDYASKTIMPTIRIPSWINAVRVLGYAAAGDGGEALYKRVAVEPTHEGKFQSADGAWWEYVPGENGANVRAFGAVGDAVTDDRAAIQNTVDFSIYFAECPTYLPVGDYVNAGTLQFGYGTSFKTMRVVGEFKPFRADIGTIIRCTALDRPGINVQGGRHVVIENLLVHGPLFTAYGALSVEGREITLEATWDTAEAGAGGASSRYAPLAGITVDAYSGARPATSYPDVSYPSFLGAVAQYGKNFTSRVQLVNVGIHGWNTALAIQPCDADGNGDFMSWEQPYIENCKYAVSAGNSQGRRFMMIGGEARKVFCLFVNGKHGKQIGHLGADVTGLSGYGYIGALFDLVSADTAGSMYFEVADFENFHRIGDIGNTSIGPQIVIETAQFNFRHTNVKGVPPNVLNAGSGEVLIRGGQLDGTQNVYSFLGNVRIEGTTIRVEEARAKDYQKIFHNATQGGIMTDPLITGKQVCAFTPFNLSTGNSLGIHQVVDERYHYTNRDYLLPIKSERVRRFGSYNSSGDRVSAATFFNTDDASTFTAVTIDERTITLTNAAITNDTIANSRGYMPGDIMRHRDTGTVAAIRSRSTTTIIAELMNNYIDVGGTFEFFDDTDVIDLLGDLTGVWAFIMARQYTPPYKLFGTTTAASPDITALKTKNAAAYNGGLVANDWMWSDVMEVPMAGTGDSRISSIDTVTPKIVMAGNQDNSHTTLALDYWIKAAPANEAAR